MSVVAMVGQGYQAVWVIYNITQIYVQGELLCISRALPHVRHRGTLSVSLPNAANLSFDYSYALVVILLSYIPRKSTAVGFGSV